MQDLHNIIQQISRTTGEYFQPDSIRHVGGGSINSSLLLGDQSRQYFIKLNQPGLSDMFSAEAAGLKELREADSMRVPQAICSGADENHSWLVLEYIHFSYGDADSSHLAGEQFARLHRHFAANFGWQRNNTIGSTTQINDWASNWGTFWKNQRLGFQLELARTNGYSGALLSLGEQLLERCDAFFDHNPRPSLLHGDLWGGNMAFDEAHRPVIFDPAVYYGDREADLAMTELFGGFGQGFYTAYQQTWPLDSGYQSRKTLYNLYHIINHTNLFGGGYQSQAVAMMQRLLAELK